RRGLRDAVGEADRADSFDPGLPDRSRQFRHPAGIVEVLERVAAHGGVLRGGELRGCPGGSCHPRKNRRPLARIASARAPSRTHIGLSGPRTHFVRQGAPSYARQRSLSHPDNELRPQEGTACVSSSPTPSEAGLLAMSRCAFTMERTCPRSNGFSSRRLGRRARNSRARGVKAPPVMKTTRSACSGLRVASRMWTSMPATSGPILSHG